MNLTLATEHLMIINQDNLYLHLKGLLEALSLELLCDVTSPSLPE